MVEYRLAKARVAGSNPVSRSFIFVGTFVLQRIPAFLFLKIFIGKCLAEGECIMLQNKYIQLAPPSLSFAEQAADYYCRNREFLREYEPRREAAFFTAERQQEILEQEIRSQQAMNCSPSRGQRKNIKFSRPAAKCCWPLFMQQGTTCVFLSASVRPSYAGLFWCCNNGCSTQSFARVPVCW